VPGGNSAAYAKGTGADLTAVGAWRSASLAKRVTGSMGRRVLRATACCVPVVRPNDWINHVSRGGAS